MAIINLLLIIYTILYLASKIGLIGGTSQTMVSAAIVLLGIFWLFLLIKRRFPKFKIIKVIGIGLLLIFIFINLLVTAALWALRPMATTRFSSPSGKNELVVMQEYDEYGYRVYAVKYKWFFKWHKDGLIFVYGFKDPYYEIEWPDENQAVVKFKSIDNMEEKYNSNPNIIVNFK